jgi:uncharacterized C2H2 Zn-finger protein
MCSAVFFDRAQQRRHTKLTHGEVAAANANKWPCSLCPAHFRLHSKLTEHVLTSHMHVKPWVCSQCGKSFSDQRNYHTHLAMHEGKRAVSVGLMKHRDSQAERYWVRSSPQPQKALSLSD